MRIHHDFSHPISHCVQFIRLVYAKENFKLELYAITFFTLYFQLFTDIYLHAKLDWYGYFQEGIIEWKTILVVPVYAGGAMIYANFFPFERSRIIKMYYIFAFSIFLTFYEWLADLSGFFYHNEWKLWHSALAYPFILAFVTWNLLKIRKMYIQRK